MLRAAEVIDPKPAARIVNPDLMRIIALCVICGKPTAGGRKTCSASCLNTRKSEAQSGHLSHRWKADGVTKAQSHLRARSVCTDTVCSRCGSDALDVHHVDGDPYNNAPSNLAPLCRSCHMLIDGRAAALAAGNRERGLLRASATHCRRGHEFSPENTYVAPSGARRCRSCHQEWRIRAR